MIKKLVGSIIQFLRQRKIAKSKGVIFKQGVILCGENTFKGKNLINNGVALTDCEIGLGSYISGNSNLRKVKMGNFCSIGQNVTNGIGLHPSKEFVSTHPAFFSTKQQAGFSFTDKTLYEEHKYIDEGGKFYIEIGSDVWIENNVVIFDGVTIGDGAIIGTGAVVTKSVEPFAIVGGVPAKLIRYRFDEKTRLRLMELKWWHKDFEWIKQNHKKFSNVNGFLEGYGA